MKVDGNPTSVLLRDGAWHAIKEVLHDIPDEAVFDFVEDLGDRDVRTTVSEKDVLGLRYRWPPPPKATPKKAA